MDAYTCPRGDRNKIEELAYLLVTQDRAFGEGLQTFIGMLERDFRIEETVMETIGFNDIKAHREQHAHIAAALHGVFSEVLNGNQAPAHALLEALPQWMIYHLIKMDAGLFAAADRAGLKSMLPGKSVLSPEFFRQLSERECHAGQ